MFVERDDFLSVVMCKMNIIVSLGFFLFVLEFIDLVKSYCNLVINILDDKLEFDFKFVLWVCLYVYYFNLVIENYIFVLKIGYFFLYDLYFFYIL